VRSASSTRSITRSSALSRVEEDRYTLDETQRMLFVLPHMVQSLVHGTARAPFSDDGARKEAIRAVVLYAKSCRSSVTQHP
jgi:hypothetical protein